MPSIKNEYESVFAGQYDVFVTKINPSLSGDSSLLYSTFLGGSNGGAGADTGTGIAVDASGNIYITGDTDSTDFPTTANAYQETNAGGVTGSVDAFVTKLDPSQTEADQLIYSTYLGGEDFMESGGLS